jgi:tRNA-dihydrouridine synthase C
MAGRLKQWLKIAARYGSFSQFDAVKEASTVEELFVLLTASRHLAARRD